jgi:hypothetical protein
MVAGNRAGLPAGDCAAYCIGRYPPRLKSKLSQGVRRYTIILVRERRASPLFCCAFAES